MGDVIEFPSRTVQGWAQIERTLRETFSKSNATVEMQDEVIGQMKEVYQRYDLQFSVTFEMPANLSEQQKESVASAVERAFGEYARQLHGLTTQVLFERLLIEIELYKLRHDSETTST